MCLPKTLHACVRLGIWKIDILVLTFASMLKDGLGRVLFIGPAHVTKWMGGSVVHNPAMMKAMTSNGYRLARLEDKDFIDAEQWVKVVGKSDQPKGKRPRIQQAKPVATSTPQKDAD